MIKFRLYKSIYVVDLANRSSIKNLCKYTNGMHLGE